MKTDPWVTRITFPKPLMNLFRCYNKQGAKLSDDEFLSLKVNSPPLEANKKKLQQCPIVCGGVIHAVKNAAHSAFGKQINYNPIFAPLLH